MKSQQISNISVLAGANRGSNPDCFEVVTDQDCQVYPENISGQISGLKPNNKGQQLNTGVIGWIPIKLPLNLSGAQFVSQTSLRAAISRSKYATGEPYPSFTDPVPEVWTTLPGFDAATKKLGVFTPPFIESVGTQYGFTVKKSSAGYAVKISASSKAIGSVVQLKLGSTIHAEWKINDDCLDTIILVPAVGDTAIEVNGSVYLTQYGSAQEFTLVTDGDATNFTCTYQPAYI